MSATLNASDFNGRRTSAFGVLGDKQRLGALKLKTKMCRNPETCRFGDTCHFAHRPSDLQKVKCAFGSTCRKFRNGTCTFDHANELSPPVADEKWEPVPVQRAVASAKPVFNIHLDDDSDEGDSGDDTE